MQDMINGKKPVYAKETPLSVAKEIQGLRAVFDEVGTREELCSRDEIQLHTFRLHLHCIIA